MIYDHGDCDIQRYLLVHEDEIMRLSDQADIDHGCQFAAHILGAATAASFVHISYKEQLQIVRALISCVRTEECTS